MRAILSTLNTGALCRLSPMQQAAFQSGRCLMTSGQTPSNIHDDFHVKVMRFIAGIMIAAAGVKVLPFAGSALVEHTVKLMRMEKAFLQDAGLTRLYYLTYFDSAKKIAVDVGAVEALVGLLDTRLSLSAQSQNKPLMILKSLSGIQGFRDRLDCPALLTLLYSLESAQLDGECDSWVAPNYSISRDLYKSFCK